MVRGRMIKIKEGFSEASASRLLSTFVSSTSYSLNFAYLTFLYHSTRSCSHSLSHAQKAHFHSAPGYQPQKIGHNAQYHMYQNFPHPSHPYLQQPVPPLDYREKPLNMRPLLVDLLEFRRVSYHPHFVHYRLPLMQIENWTISGPPASLPEKTKAILLHKGTPEFVSLSLPVISPVKQFQSSLTDYVSFLSYKDISSCDRVFPVSFVLGDIGCDVMVFEEGEVLNGVIGCICEDFFYVSVFGNYSFGFFNEWFEHFSIVFIAGGYFDGYWDRWVGIGDSGVYFVAEEEEIHFFYAPFGIFIGFEGFKVSGVNGEGEFFFGYNGDSLGYEVGEDGEEGIWAESFSEVVEGGVGGSIAEGEAGEEGESGVIFEFRGEVSFGVGEAEVDEEDSFEEGGGVIAVGAFRFVVVIDDIGDGGEVDGFEEDFEGVIWGNEFFNGEVKEGKLKVVSQCCPPFCSCSNDSVRWGYEQGGGCENNELFQWI